MRTLRPTTKYGRDLRRQKRRNKDLAKIDAAIETLQEFGELPATYRPHKLSGDLAGVWECHIEGDWLLLYEVTKDEVILIRTGTHADLFK